MIHYLGQEAFFEREREEKQLEFKDLPGKIFSPV